MRLFTILTLLFLSSTSYAEQPKCLHVTSYSPGYEWQDKIDQSLHTVIDKECDVKTIYLNSKSNSEPQQILGQVHHAITEIHTWQPDIIIAGDDNTSRYLVTPYLKGAATPVVFYGINFSGAEYGYPYKNATGVIELKPLKKIFEVGKDTLDGLRQASCIYPNLVSEKKLCQFFSQEAAKHNVQVKAIPVKNMAELDIAIKQAQLSDLVLLTNNQGIADWDHDKASKIMRLNKKLSVSTNNWLSPYVMLIFSDIPAEQGQLAGEYVVELLYGEEIKDLPLMSNRRWTIQTNKLLLSRAEIKLPTYLNNQPGDRMD